MAKYSVEVEWAGYSRGSSTYVVEAGSEDEAKERWFTGQETERETVRDDTEGEANEATLING